MTDEANHTPAGDHPLDPRVEELRRRLAEALLEVNYGEYFRSRIHGWVAYRHDADVVLPDGIAGRLKSQFSFERDPEDAEEVATLDAFVIAYHAAECCYRLLFALHDEARTRTASALLAMNELKAGKDFNDRIEALAGLTDDVLTQVLDFLFLPPELKQAWPNGADEIEEVQEYLCLWCRTLGRFLDTWRNPYNAAKHGLSVGARQTQFTLVATDPPAPPAEMANGPMLRTVEHEFETADDGRPIKVNGVKVLRWFWMYRAVDPEELISQAIVTADLLDWAPRHRSLPAPEGDRRSRSGPCRAEAARSPATRVPDGDIPDGPGVVAHEP